MGEARHPCCSPTPTLMPAGPTDDETVKEEDVDLEVGGEAAPAADVKTQRKTANVQEDENAKIKELFDKFDDSPKDGVLQKHEFIVAMKALYREFIDANANPSEDVLMAAFKKADTDGNGHVDLQEFTVAYSALKKYKEDPNGIAKKAALVEVLLGAGSRVIPGLGQAIETSSKVSETVKVKPFALEAKGEETALLPSSDEQKLEEVGEEVAAEFSSILNMMITAFMCLFTTIIIFTVGPTIVFWYGVVQGEKCDQPLDTWMMGMAISSTINAIPVLVVLCAIGSLLSALMSGSPDTLKDSNCGVAADGSIDQDKLKAHFTGGSGNASFECTSKLLQLFGFIWFIYGAYVFDGAGGFGSAKTQCMTKAPTLFAITYYYYLISIIMLCVVCFCPCLIICCLVGAGGSPTQGAMNRM